MVMTDLSFLAVLRNESCIFCAGLLSIGHSPCKNVKYKQSLSQQIPQPEKPNYAPTSLKNEKLLPVRKASRSGQDIRYGHCPAISTRIQDWEVAIFAVEQHAPVRDLRLALRGSQAGSGEELSAQRRAKPHITYPNITYNARSWKSGSITKSARRPGAICSPVRTAVSRASTRSAGRCA